jgi:hypothetical protein
VACFGLIQYPHCSPQRVPREPRPSRLRAVACRAALNIEDDSAELERKSPTGASAVQLLEILQSSLAARSNVASANGSMRRRRYP